MARSSSAVSVIPHAFIWDPSNGERVLQTVLVNDFGLNLTGWTLQVATGVSADGTIIVGRGTHNGQTEGWVAHLPAPDTDGDGLLDDWESNGIPYVDSTGATQRYI